MDRNRVEWVRTCELLARWLCPTPTIALALALMEASRVVRPGGVVIVAALSRRDPALNADALELARAAEAVMAETSIHRLARGIRARQGEA